MKKTIVTCAIAFASVIGLNAAAQSTNTAAATGATQTEHQCCKESKDKKACAHQHGEGACVKEGDRFKDMKKINAFEGITLTDAQKESLKALRPERPEKKSGEKKDSVAARPDFKKMRADYVNGVKGILTPDQYVLFLENIVINGADIPGDRQMHMHRPMPRHDKDGKQKEKKNGPRKDKKAPSEKQ